MKRDIYERTSKVEIGNSIELVDDLLKYTFEMIQSMDDIFIFFIQNLTELRQKITKVNILRPQADDLNSEQND